jgi:hypothetical protein
MVQDVGQRDVLDRLQNSAQQWISEEVRFLFKKYFPSKETPQKVSQRREPTANLVLIRSG